MCISTTTTTTTTTSSLQAVHAERELELQCRTVYSAVQQGQRALALALELLLVTLFTPVPCSQCP